jgi:hypothetical protein
MAQGQIDKVIPSKSGKSLSVYVGGARYQAKLDSGLENAVHKTITFDPKVQQLQDGSKIYWINEFTVSGGLAEPAAPEAPQGARATINGHPPSPYQPMCSNLAAALIAAGKAPEDLAPWFRVCKGLLDGSISDEEPQF